MPQKLRQAILRHYGCRKIEVRGRDTDSKTVWAWGDLFDPNNIEAEYWKCLGPLRLVKINVLRNYDPDYRPEDDL